MNCRLYSFHYGCDFVSARSMLLLLLLLFFHLLHTAKHFAHANYLIVPTLGIIKFPLHILVLTGTCTVAHSAEPPFAGRLAVWWPRDRLNVRQLHWAPVATSGERFALCERTLLTNSLSSSSIHYTKVTFLPIFAQKQSFHSLSLLKQQNWYTLSL